MSFNGRVIRDFSTEAGSIAETEHRAAFVPAHSHSQLTLCLVTRGEVRESVRGSSFRHGANDLLFRRAGERHADLFGPRGARCFNVAIEPSILDASMTLLTRAAMPIVKRLRRELHGDTSALIVEGLLLQLAGELSRDATARKSVAARASEIIRERFDTKLTIASIAAEIGAHPVHVMRSFRATFGIGIAGAVRELRISHAASLLRGPLPIAEVAMASGFADQSHFTRVFHRTTGMTPRRYRLSV
jgi:AraC family transcriptional regulator